MSIELLQTLHHVLAEGSVAGAARRLHVTPSAVSNALARLRDQLGDPLVTRKGRGIVPTPRALELAPVLARSFAELEAAVTRTAFDPATTTRRFTVAVADPGQITWIPRIAACLAADMPHAHLRVVGIDALVALGDLSSPEVDLHLGLRGRGPGLHAETLYDERTVLVARRAARLSRAALACLRHVAVDMLPARRMRDRVADAYARAGIRRDVAMTVPTFVTAAAIVHATDLVATMPASLVEAHGARLGVRALTGPIPAHDLEMAMCWHDRTHRDPAAVAFRVLVRGAITR